MTEQTKSKVPQIRFKGFDGKWEEKTLGDESGEIIAGGDVEKHKLCDRGNYPVIANALQNHGILGFYKNDFRVKAPAVTVTGRGDVGHAVVRETNFTPVVRLVSVKISHDVHFLKESINNHRVIVESTGVPQLTVPQLSKYRICFPAAILEESQIGGYFREVDRLIGLHHRKHDKLVTLKKAMLQKMFPQPGATTPEIRFKGFEGEWVEKNLGDVATIINGRAYSQNELLNSGPYRVLRVGNFYTNSSWYFSDMELAEKFYAKKGDLLYTWSASFGPHIWTGEKVIYHYHIWKVELSEQLRKEFTLQLLENDKKRILNDSNGSTMIHITKEGMELTKILIPQPNEQQKIGNYFRTLDELISKHAIQLQKLKQIKSACLEKMFV